MSVRKWLGFVISFTFILSSSTFLVCSSAYSGNKASVDVDEGDEWYYFKGINEPPPKWNHIGFRKGDKDWHKGQTGIGYGDQRVRSHLDDMRNNYLSIYAKHDFNLSKANYELLQTGTIKLKLSIICDGPFKVWLNGVELIRSHNQRVASVQELKQGLDIDATLFARELLQLGSNVLSIQCANDRIDSANFLFIAALKMTGE